MIGKSKVELAVELSIVGCILFITNVLIALTGVQFYSLCEKAISLLLSCSGSSQCDRAQWFGGKQAHFNKRSTCDQHVLIHMSRVVRKPAFCRCENKDADQLRGNREADQRLCFRYIDSAIPLVPK